MNIDHEKIQSFKRMNLPEIVESYGYQVKKQSSGYITNCPFHEDNTPSLSINQKGEVWLWHCFGCHKGGTVIDFVRAKENLTLKETYERLSSLQGETINTYRKKIPAKPRKEETPYENYSLLKTVTDFYHKAFLGDKKAHQYLKSRGIVDPEIYKSFKIGYASGSLKKILSLKGDTIKKLKLLGILNAQGNEVFYNCIVIPLLDIDGNVVSLYGRNITRKSHLYLKGPHKGIVNAHGAYDTKQLILTESIIDALSLYQMGVRNAIPCYGTGGFTQDHKDLILKQNIQQIELTFDNDEAGLRGSESLAGELALIGVEDITRKLLPEGVKDVNDLLLEGRDYKALEEEKLRRSTYLVEKENDIIHLTRSNIKYRIRVGIGGYIRSMKVNIKLTMGDDYTIDIVDLYSGRSRKGYIKRMNARFNISAIDLEKDLYRIIEEVEKLKDPEDEDQEPDEYIMTFQEKTEAIKELKSPDLIKNIIKDLGRIGCVGEDTNKLLGYIVTISRKLPQPLSMIIVSQSGAGKSSLAGIMEEVTPPEEALHLSRITPQALYYMGRESIKRKVLVIEEKEGSREADYSIRVLQSKKVLRLAVPMKDVNSGKLKTQVFEVEGPVVVIETTTKTDLNPENTSRCFIVYMDETEEQTKRIHSYQRKSKTIEGEDQRKESDEIIKKHRNMQRILDQVVVSNPYIEHITFPTKWIRTRRDNMKFLNLIEAVTFLNQYKRERKLSGGGIEYIESTLEDYRIAYDVAKEVIGDSFSELMKPEEELYERIKEMVENLGKDTFTRRELRDCTGLPDHHVRKVIKTLCEMEYLLIADGRNGVRYEYKINPYTQEAKDIIGGLTTPEELEEKLSSYVTLQQPCTRLAARLTMVS